MQTLLLLPSTWDLTVDVSGNIAVASDPYSMAQDAASEIKTFAGEVYYDTTIGVPFWASILGKLPALTLVKAKFVAAALRVPGVVAARCFISSFTGRKLSGQVQIVDASGTTTPAAF